MKRTVSLLLITLVSCFSATAQTAKTRRPALPSDISAVAGQDSDSLLKNPVIKARMKKLLGNKYDSFMESFETLNPVIREGSYLFSSGCLIHACTHLESAIAVNLTDHTIHAAIFRQDEKTRYFNEGGKATPGVIRDWANHLRQINNPTNSSESRSSLAASDVAVAQVNAHAGTAPSEARKFDEFGDVCCEDEKARLDNFANELQNNPEVQGYIVFYGGKRRQYPTCHNSRLALPRRGEAEARVARLKPYMHDTRGVDSNRIVVVNGGYRDQWAAELWIVPKGVNPPTPTPTVKPQEIKFRRGRIKKSDYECGV